MTEPSESRPLFLRIDDTCDKFESAWKSGKPIPLRDVLDASDAATEERPTFFRELMLLDFELRSQAGKPADLASYQTDFPEFQDVVSKVFAEFHAKSHPAGSRSETIDFETVSQYRLVEPIAEGGLGRIFRVYEKTLGRELAMKEIKQGVDSANARARFDREARLTGRLDHPGITPVFGFGAHKDGRPLYVMRLIRGESLRAVIQRHFASDNASTSTSLMLKNLLTKFVSVCDVIAYAHSQGVVHRDLKPSNIMLGPYGEVLVVDWGLAKEVSPSVLNDHVDWTSTDTTITREIAIPADSFQTVPGRAVGTPQYMSPEQALARVDEIGPLSDIYSLGATLYDLLTGRPPFAESTYSDAVLRRVVVGDFLHPRKLHPRLSKSLEAICLKAMALAPAQRYSNAEALAEDLRRWLADEPISARGEPFWERARRWIARRRVAVAGFAGALILALCLGIPLMVSARIAAASRTADAKLHAAAIVESKDEVTDGLNLGLGVDPAATLRQLAIRFHAPNLDDDGKLKAALVLGPASPEIRDFLETRLLDSPLLKVPLICRTLKNNHSTTLLDRLRKTLESEVEAIPKRFHAAVALARLSTFPAAEADKVWAANSSLIVDNLVDSISNDPSLFDNLVDSFKPVRHKLFSPLSDRFRDLPQKFLDGRQAALRTIAAAILDRYADTPEELAELLLDTDPGIRFERFLKKIDELNEPGRKALLDQLKRPFFADDNQDPESAADLEATRKARIAVALFALPDRETVWPYFGSKTEPDLRARIIRRLPRLSFESRAAIIAQIPVEPDPAIRQGLIESLASFPVESLATEIPKSTKVWLLDKYQADPDAGVHGTIDWLLRTVLERSKDVETIEAKLKGIKPADGFHWFINTKGQTFSVIRHTDPVSIGSPNDEEGRGPSEFLHQVKIGRAFAIGTREVSFDSYKGYVADEPKTTHPLPILEVPAVLRNDTAPVIAVSWQDVAGYCNWLSKQDGIPESEWCYADIGLDQMSLDPNMLQKRGYRLPTEAEWETACRAGTLTSRSFGNGWEFAVDYGWFPHNADGLLRPAGAKRPNGFGLFDMLGNASEWTLTQYKSSNFPAGPKVTEDLLDGSRLQNDQSRVTRGGSILMPSRPRSAMREPSLPTNRTTDLGFRVCRTLP